MLDTLQLYSCWLTLGMSYIRSIPTPPMLGVKLVKQTLEFYPVEIEAEKIMYSK